MEQMKKAGLSEDEIKKELDYLQEQYDKEG